MDRFVGKLKDIMASLVVGDGLDSNSTIGPLINVAQFEKVLDIRCYNFNIVFLRLFWFLGVVNGKRCNIKRC